MFGSGIPGDQHLSKKGSSVSKGGSSIQSEGKQSFSSVFLSMRQQVNQLKFPISLRGVDISALDIFSSKIEGDSFELKAVKVNLQKFKSEPSQFTLRSLGKSVARWQHMDACKSQLCLVQPSLNTLVSLAKMFLPKD